jgi:hypothetical protein
MNFPALLIQFDDAWTPTTFIISETDQEEAKLQEIAARMLETIERPDDEA